MLTALRLYFLVFPDALALCHRSSQLGRARRHEASESRRDLEDDYGSRVVLQRVQVLEPDGPGYSLVREDWRVRTSTLPHSSFLPSRGGSIESDDADMNVAFIYQARLLLAGARLAAERSLPRLGHLPKIRSGHLQRSSERRLPRSLGSALALHTRSASPRLASRYRSVLADASSPSLFWCSWRRSNPSPKRDGLP
jgi:hypothetical protein